MEGLFEREMDPLQTRRCDIVSFTGQNPGRAKGVASAQVCSGRHVRGSFSYTTLSFRLILPSLHLLSPASVHPLTPSQLLYSGEVSSSSPGPLL